MRWLVLAAAVLLPSRLAAESVWHDLPNAPPPAGVRHDDVWFVTPTDGWVVNSFGNIWNTTDGGESWQLQLDVGNFFRSVTFATPIRGWVGAVFTSTPVLYETTNAGATWTQVMGLPTGMPGGICGMWATDENVVWAVGRYSMPAGVLKTTDAGASWSFLDVSAWVTTLVDCWFPTPDFGFVVGSTGTFPDASRAVVLRTTDGGATWDPRHVSSQLGGWCWKISFPSPDVGYASVERPGGPMFFLKSTDGGDTWTEKPAPAGMNQQGVGFLTEEHGWLGGDAEPFQVTTDGGDTWRPAGNVHWLNRIRFLRDDLAYAVGGSVYRYSPLNPTSVETLASVPGALLERPAPNPFRESTVIPFALSRASDTRLEVFDVVGRRVRTLHEGLAGAGLHRLAWDGRDDRGRQVPAGVYFVRLAAEGRSEGRPVQRHR